jgi:hypothetical protein
MLILLTTITACTKAPNQVVVSFDTFGGTSIESVTVDAGTTFGDLNIPDPSKDGYRFVSWYETSELFPYDDSKIIVKDTQLKAHFIELFTLTFDDGATTTDMIVDDGAIITDIPTPTADGFEFQYWYTDDENSPFDFSLPIESNATLHAKWDLTADAKLALDIQYYEDNMFISNQLLYVPTKGHYYKSKITYDMDSQYISDHGVILSLLYGEQEHTESFSVTFKLDDVSVTKEYDILLKPNDEVVLTNDRVVDFENLSTEFTVPDSQLDLYYEDNGSVPYVKIEDFINMLTGFIDPDVNLTFDTTDTTLTISYQYYDEEEDQNYDLSVTIDSVENTIDVNDPAFFWAYTYSTETNYGRNIEYLNDDPNVYNSDSSDVVYDLDLYNMDIVMVDGDVVVPYYIANQLFVGSSYYNVYYNYDGLYGIYMLPDSSSKEYRTIHNSSMTGEKLPVDMVESTFNMLAFDLDYMYGLKDIMGVDTYYDLLFDMKDDLLTTNPDDLDQAIADLLLQNIDEPHTSYGYMSYYSEVEPSTSSLSDYGSRFTNWYLDGLSAVDDVIAQRFGAASSGWNVSRKPDYWFLDDNSVMVSLNNFNTADIYEGALYDQDTVNNILDFENGEFTLPAIPGSYYYYYNSSSLTADLLEVLVKQDDANAYDNYKQSLLDDGYTLVTGTSGETYKQNGYFTKDITLNNSDTISMFVLVSYDDNYNLLYVGVAKSVPSDYSTSWPLEGNVRDLVLSDSAVYMEETLENVMAEKPTVTNAILDLSWNTGGNVGALYRVLGFITDQPFVVSGIDRTTDSQSSYVVSITKANPYTSLNWALLTTKVTFSAANSMTTIFRANDLGPIIGVQTGGGACSITPMLMPNGTAFTTSSNNISAIRTGSGTESDPYVFTPVEFGLVPDFTIPLEDIYDADVLLALLND